MEQGPNGPVMSADERWALIHKPIWSFQVLLGNRVQPRLWAGTIVGDTFYSSNNGGPLKRKGGNGGEDSYVADYDFD